MLGMNDIRKGKAVVLDGDPYVVVSSEFVRKQAGRLVMRSSLRHLKTGQTKEHSFMQSDKIQEADTEKRQYQYLYDDQGYVFMDQDNFEQYTLDQDQVGDAAEFLMEGQDVTVLLFEGSPVSIELPIKVDRKVLVAPDGVKGDTSTNVMKDIEVEGGIKIKAPLFVKEGDIIRIDTRNVQYVERV